MSTNYSFSMENGVLKFSCNDPRIMEDVQDYIERYIDAENYRRNIWKVERIFNCEEDEQ